MFNNPEVTNSPYFLLLIAASVLLSLGYTWGRRRNKKIFLSAFDGLVEALNPKDQQFTNIGGLSGYHANIIPKNSKTIRRVDATVTLLPRQAWLWFPISRIVRKFDRLYAVFYLSPKIVDRIEEGHVLEQGYSKMGGAKIANEESLQKEVVEWSGMTFFLYYASPRVREELVDCMKDLGEAGPIRHIALVPEQQRMWLFMIPRIGSVHPIVLTVIRWLSKTVTQRA